MGLLNEMSGASGGYASKASAKSLREAVIQTGARLFDECDGEYDSHHATLGRMLEANDEKSQYEAGMTLLMVKRTQDYLESAISELGEATVTASLGSLPKRVLDVVRKAA